MFVAIMATLIIGVGGGALIYLFARPLNVSKRTMAEAVSAIVFFVGSYLGLLAGAI